MHWVDITIFIIYVLAMLGVGLYFFRKNKNIDDYFVGGRKMNSLHIGLSLAATDVGGGFSIGLGGLGFVMGLSGSWLLFTGFVGAWLSGVFLVPSLFDLARKKGFLSFPQFLKYIYNPKVALIAGIISAIGYLGFTSSQILAGAKLASATFEGLSVPNALLIMGVVAVGYTVMGGLKAVIYTDTLQWIVLISGLTFISLPICFNEFGGFNSLRELLPDGFLRLTNLTWQQFINWMLTIIPIWFIGMTLYQRIYASKDKKTAQKAWFIAGLFEYPIMAFSGVLLGMFARVSIENGILQGTLLTDFDPEMGIPILLKTILPVGLMGIVLASYFSAIMSTADSCLIASSGNILTDILGLQHSKRSMLWSHSITLFVGALAILIAIRMPNVLELVLHSYSFMVAGMIIPVLAALFTRKPNSTASFWAMICGGSSTLLLIFFDMDLPLGLEPTIYGILISTVVYIVIYILSSNTQNQG